MQELLCTLPIVTKLTLAFAKVKAGQGQHASRRLREHRLPMIYSYHELHWQLCLRADPSPGEVRGANGRGG